LDLRIIAIAQNIIMTLGNCVSQSQRRQDRRIARKGEMEENCCGAQEVLYAAMIDNSVRIKKRKVLS
jgi:hypothetical protein